MGIEIALVHGGGQGGWVWEEAIATPGQSVRAMMGCGIRCSDPNEVGWPSIQRPKILRIAIRSATTWMRPKDRRF